MKWRIEPAAWNNSVKVLVREEDRGLVALVVHATETDLRLIKAAPSMLEALEIALETVMWPSYEVQQIVETAVREAKGE